jgi:hypothetical protein
MKRRKRVLFVPVLEGKRVNFLDPKHGFWRMGECYKEEPLWVSVRNPVGKRFRVPNNPLNVQLYVEPNQKGNV